MNGIIKIQTGQMEIVPDTCEVIFQGTTVIVNNRAGQIMIQSVPLGTHEIKFGRATHPFFEMVPPSPVKVVVQKEKEVLAFGKYSHVSQSSPPCGFAGMIFELIPTGAQIQTNHGLVAERVAKGIPGITVYAWFPPQRTWYRAPRFPWRDSTATGFRPMFLAQSITDANGVFRFLNLPLPPNPKTTPYCFGFEKLPGYFGGGEIQHKVEDSICWIELEVNKSS